MEHVVQKHIFIIPVYNEAKIVSVSAKLIFNYLDSNASNDKTWTIVIADNGSTDKTKEEVKKLILRKSKSVNLVYERITKKGRGNALRKIVKKQKGDYYYYSDVDLPFRLSDLTKLSKSLKSGVDVVVGKRVGKRPLKRRFLTSALRHTVNVLFNLKLSDPQCGLKAFNKAGAKVLAEHCKESGYFLDTELLVLSNNLGLRVSEVPIHWIESRYLDRHSKIRLLSDSTDAIRSIYRLTKDLYPNFLNKYLAFVALGLATLVIFVIGKFVFAPAGLYPAEHVAKLITPLQIQAIILCLPLGVLFLYTKKIHDFPWKLVVVTGLTIFTAIAFVSIVTPPTRSADAFWNLLLVKGFVQNGFNPYLTTPSMLSADSWFQSVAAWQDLAMTHGPVWVWLLSLPVFVTNSLKDALIIGKLEMLVVFAGALLVLWRLMGHYKLHDRKKAFILLFMVWNPFVIQNVLIDLHNDTLVMLAISFALLAYVNKRFLVSAISLLMGALVKYVPAILMIVPLFALINDSSTSYARRIRQLILACVLVALVTIFFFFPFQTGQNTLPGLTNEIVVRSSSVFSLPGSFLLKISGVSPFVIRVIGLVGSAGLALYFIYRKRELLAFTLPILFIFVFGMPWFQPWYVLWIFPILLLLIPYRWMTILSVCLLLMPNVLFPLSVSVMLLIGLAWYYLLISVYKKIVIRSA